MNNTIFPIRQPGRKSSNVNAMWHDDKSVIVLYNTGKFYLFIANVAQIDELCLEHTKPGASMGTAVNKVLGRRGVPLEASDAYDLIWGEVRPYIASNADLEFEWPADASRDSFHLFGIPESVMVALLGDPERDDEPHKVLMYWDVRDSQERYLHVYDWHRSSETNEWNVSGDPGLVRELFGSHLERED